MPTPEKRLTPEEIESLGNLMAPGNDPLGGLLPKVQEYIKKGLGNSAPVNVEAPALPPPEDRAQEEQAPPPATAKGGGPPPPAPPPGPAGPPPPPEAAPVPKSPAEAEVLPPKAPTPALTPRKDPGGDAQVVQASAPKQPPPAPEVAPKPPAPTPADPSAAPEPQAAVPPEPAQNLYPADPLDDFLEQQAQASGLRRTERSETDSDVKVPQGKGFAADQQGAQATEPKKSFAPNWYESLPPPDDTVQRALGAGFGGLMKAIVAAHGKGRKKHKGEAESNFLTTLIGEGVAPAVDIGLSSDRQVYDDRLKAATAQANMEKMASGKSENPWEGLRYGLSREKFEEELRKQQAKEARAERLKDPNSTDSRELQEELIKLRPNLTPEQIAQIRQTPGAMIEEFRPQLGNQASQERGQDYAVKNMLSRQGYDQAKFVQENREHDRRQGIEQEQVLAKEERQRIASIEEASIPTLELINKRRPPDIGTVNKARELLGARDAITDSALRLAELQNQVDNVLVQGIGSWNAVFGNESQAEVLAEMQSLQQDMAAAQRVMKDQGVPQVYELIENLKTNPAADSWKTFFTGKSAWKALAKTVGRRANHRLKAYNYKDEGSATPTVGGGAQAPAAKKTFKVSIFEPDTKTWSDPKTISEQRLQKARAKAKAAGFDPDAIIKVVQE